MRAHLTCVRGGIVTITTIWWLWHVDNLWIPPSLNGATSHCNRYQNILSKVLNLFSSSATISGGTSLRFVESGVGLSWGCLTLATICSGKPLIYNGIRVTLEPAGYGNVVFEATGSSFIENDIFLWLSGVVVGKVIFECLCGWIDCSGGRGIINDADRGMGWE